MNTEHFKGKTWNKELSEMGKSLIPLEKILVKNSHFQIYKLKHRLFAGGLKKKSREECGWAKCATFGRLPLELDHINGDRHDNILENLGILCPNCHSLKPTHGGQK